MRREAARALLPRLSSRFAAQPPRYRQRGPVHTVRGGLQARELVTMSRGGRNYRVQFFPGGRWLIAYVHPSENDASAVAFGKGNLVFDTQTDGSARAEEILRTLIRAFHLRMATPQEISAELLAQAALGAR